MVKMVKSNPIKDLGNILISVTLGGAAIGSIGSSLGSFSGATQSLVSLGVMSTAAKPLKKLIKW